MLNHTSSLRYDVAGETPVSTTLRRGRHEIDKIKFKRICSLKTRFRAFIAFCGKNIECRRNNV
ncbi:MAG: hypothetical protein B1H05_00270 [Candidatus Cloacimonas sp. 4484_140]|nr:MAG: hypothetical protein B1H05_00270 [Candidatus Cloacimonas sp. 4484_140]